MQDRVHVDWHCFQTDKKYDKAKTSVCFWYALNGWPASPVSRAFAVITNCPWHQWEIQESLTTQHWSQAYQCSREFKTISKHT